MTKPDKQKTIKRLTYIRDSFGGGRILEMTNGEYCRYKEHLSEISELEEKHREDKLALLDRIATKLARLRGIDAYCRGWNACNTDVFRIIKQLKEQVNHDNE